MTELLTAPHSTPDRMTPAREEFGSAREDLQKVPREVLAIVVRYIRAKDALATIERQELHLSRINQQTK